MAHLARLDAPVIAAVNGSGGGGRPRVSCSRRISRLRRAARNSRRPTRAWDSRPDAGCTFLAAARGRLQARDGAAAHQPRARRAAGARLGHRQSGGRGRPAGRERCRTRRAVGCGADGRLRRGQAAVGRGGAGIRSAARPREPLDRRARRLAPKGAKASLPFSTSVGRGFPSDRLPARNILLDGSIYSKV